MVAINDKFATILKEQGHSITQTRVHVFTTLEQASPLSMQELVSKCKSVADRASVYRTIELFERLGIVIRIHIGWKYKLELSDAFSHHHHHATCTACGIVISLDENDELEQFLRQMAREHGFTVTSHQLELSGLCKSCHHSSP